MHTDLELVLYNQLGQLAEEVCSIQEDVDKAQADAEANTEEAESERVTMQVGHNKALENLQMRLDAAVEARDAALTAHQEALEGWAQKRKEYEALQTRKMAQDEEASVQANLLEPRPLPR